MGYMNSSSLKVLDYPMQDLVFNMAQLTLNLVPEGSFCSAHGSVCPTSTKDR